MLYLKALKLSLKNFIEEEKKKYGFVLMSFKTKTKQKKTFLEGYVLTEKQKLRFIQFLKQNRFCISAKIKVVADVKNRLELGWGRVCVDMVDICSQPKFKFASLREQNKARNSQVLKEEIVRILAKKKKFLLIQKQDLTNGYLPPNTVEISAKFSLKNWKGIKYAAPNKIFKSSRDCLLATAKSFLDAPYLLGGITKKGIDCSGLVQQVYWQALGILLPKYSQDQLQCGQRIALESAKPGDLIYVDDKRRDFHHVGILYQADKILHASYRMKKVVIWDLDLWWKIYRLVGVRKIIN